MRKGEIERKKEREIDRQWEERDRKRGKIE